MITTLPEKRDKTQLKRRCKGMRVHMKCSEDTVYIQMSLVLEQLLPYLAIHQMIYVNKV